MAVARDFRRVGDPALRVHPFKSGVAFFVSKVIGISAASVAEPCLHALPRSYLYVVNHHAGRILGARLQLHLPQTRHARRNLELVGGKRIHNLLVARPEPIRLVVLTVLKPHLDHLVGRNEGRKAAVRVFEDRIDFPASIVELPFLQQAVAPHHRASGVNPGIARSRHVRRRRINDRMGLDYAEAGTAVSGAHAVRASQCKFARILVDKRNRRCRKPRLRLGAVDRLSVRGGEMPLQLDPVAVERIEEEVGRSTPLVRDIVIAPRHEQVGLVDSRRQQHGLGVFPLVELERQRGVRGARHAELVTPVSLGATVAHKGDGRIDGRHVGRFDGLRFLHAAHRDHCADGVVLAAKAVHVVGEIFVLDRLRDARGE